MEPYGVNTGMGGAREGCSVKNSSRYHLCRHFVNVRYFLLFNYFNVIIRPLFK